MSERAQKALAGMQAMARPYTRRLNGVDYRWVITDFRVEGNSLVVKARVHRGTNQQGPVVLDSATDPVFDELWMVNPITKVQDGEEINPDHNPLDPASQPMRARYREDAAEALRVMLDRHLAMKLDA